jgi:energy-coupling factor transporter transmembrane protein EcfT
LPAGIILLAYSCFAAGLFVIRSITVHAALSAIVVCSLFFIPFRKVRGGAIPILLFLGFTFASNLFHQSGKVLYAVNSFIITDEGLKFAAVRTLRVFDLIFAAKVITSLAPMERMLDALGTFFSPLERIGVPVRELFLTMALTLQCFPVLKQRLSETYRENVEGKGELTVRGKIGLLASFLVPLFVESMRDPEAFFMRQGEEKGGR